MKITVPCSEFSDTMARLRNVIGQKSVSENPASLMAKLVPEEGACEFVAFSGEIDAFRCRIEPAQIENPVEMLLPVAKLFEISRNIGDDGDISLEIKQENGAEKVEVTVSKQKGRYLLVPAPAADFPDAASFAPSAQVSVRKDDLRYIFEMVSFAMAVLDPRAYLNGVYIDYEGNTLAAVATNGHRLARSVIKVDQPAAQQTGVILPSALVMEFERNARTNGDKDTQVEFSFSASQVKLAFGDKQITGRVLAGKYPDYKSVIPTQFKQEITFAREEMLNALHKVAAILIDSSSKDPSVQLNIAGGDILLETQSLDGDIAEIPVPVEHAGEDISIAFNVQYLIDVLKTLRTEKAMVQIQDSVSGIRLAGVNGGEDDYIIMPLRP